MLPALIAVALAVQAVGALLPAVPVLVMSAAAGLVADLALHRWRSDLAAVLGELRAGTPVRQAARDLLMFTALIRTGEGDQGSGYLVLLIGLPLFYALHFLCRASALAVRRSRTLPVLTRNIDARALRPSAAPPALLSGRPDQRLLAFSLPSTVGMVTTAATGSAEWATVGIAGSVLLAAAGTGMLLWRLLPGRRPVTGEQALQWLEAWFAEYQPTVGMYVCGGRSAAHQANMWLAPLARLQERPLIVLRERFMVKHLAATDIPVVCLPNVSDLMRLQHSTLKVLIHPSRSGETAQALRVPAIRHALVDHGESDEPSSRYPDAKAFDEVWVAGPAARRRYALAAAGVDDRDVVDIGRPQRDAIEPSAGPPSGPYTTVLYAPTWEGGDAGPGNTSVIQAGENIVRALLADPGVRLLYRPHRLIGTADIRAAAADARIRRMIGEATALRAVQHRGDPIALREAAELMLRTSALDRLTLPALRTGADDVEHMLLQTVPEPGRSAAAAAAAAAWKKAYWASVPPWAHRTVTGTRLDVYTCFDTAHLLIGDVSGVISDFLASGKPYAVTNTSGLAEQDFRAAFPAVRAGVVLTSDARGVPEVLEFARHPERDPFTQARADLRRHLLGPAGPPSAVRFESAVRALCARADRHRGRATSRGGLAIPRQRGTGPAPDDGTFRD
ncbi:hypothetical protein [Streptomyces sp. NPDC093223]|uniref:hypothetical protein n=1 Tax=Streptomyces sp. NPDC093223 TaxID=3366033 RepID=UPI00382F1D7F